MINKLIYLAGPYRAPTVWGIRQNIRKAEKYALEFWRRGVPVLSPHKNTALFDGAADDRVWLEGDLIMLMRCDALVLLPGWEESSGTQVEKDKAEAEGMPVFFIREDVRQTTASQIDHIVAELSKEDDH